MSLDAPKRTAHEAAAHVTAEISRLLEQGTLPWRAPWDPNRAIAATPGLPLRAKGEPYRGANVILLWAAQISRGYGKRTWLTYRQAEALGAHVCKGEKATPVIYYGQAKPRADTRKQAEDGEGPSYRFLKLFHVFNAEQLEGLADGFAAEVAPPRVAPPAIIAWIERAGARIRLGGASAHYAPTTDTIHLPPAQAFTGEAEFAATAAHEICNIASVIGCDHGVKGRPIGRPFVFSKRCAHSAPNQSRHEGGASGKRARSATASPSFAGAAAFGAERARLPLKELRRRDWPGADGATHMPTNERASIYARITDQIIAALERGVETKRMPWHHDGSAVYRPTNVASKKPYRGINTLALWAAAESKGYPTGLWGTFKQWFELGAQVRKGERASAIVLWKQVGQPDAEDGEKKRFFARGYSVFNASQVDGYEPEATPTLPDTERLTHAEAFISALNIKIVHGGDTAFYRPSTDTVHLPAFERFFDAASAYGVALHECGHASGAPHRLARDLSGRFGSELYAAEECCVELASGFVLADLGIAHNPREDHAGYIASWLSILGSDPRAIFAAASKAQEIADWMHEQQAQPAPT